MDIYKLSQYKFYKNHWVTIRVLASINKINIKQENFIILKIRGFYNLKNIIIKPLEIGQIIGLIFDYYMKQQLPDNLQDTAIELRTYLQYSFCNKEMGQEMNYNSSSFNFLDLGIDNEKDCEGIVRLAFYGNLNINSIKVQMTYMLEQTGTHGVWGLGHYQLLPFAFGATKLI
ncbi:unnamed protein product [Paramecium pentaurelia]|uniref:Serine/threonine-protein phosphatase 2A activator n=1 Tax=Paramecium pentaurelia TaxID=43138 RepID=A0A8S1SU20_9CILI|nr:unnamed protein product [Paramecium pentaurelia]